MDWHKWAHTLFFTDIVASFPFVLFFTDYGDVSGLPDPFSHEVVDNGGQNGSGQKQHPMQHMTFEESLGESGYSTPNSRNRRIIREIIVWRDPIHKSCTTIRCDSFL